MIYLAVVGSRSFNNYKLLCEAIDPILEYHQYVTIVSGGAPGADRLAAQYAKEQNLNIIEYIPDWSLGKHAGHLRNVKIIEKADKVLAFWDGKSRGTLNSIELAKKANKPIKIVRF